MKVKSNKLGIFALTTLVVSSMIGGGIYSLPQNMSAKASAGAILLSWLVTGIGMFFIANTFIILARVRKSNASGIYTYSKEIFGQYAGFSIGWGYWLCNNFANVGFAIISMNAMNYFFPGYFTGGNNVNSIICSTILIWSFNFVVLRGMKQTAILNIFATITKLIPLLFFILIMIFLFNINKLEYNFWGNIPINGKTLGSLTEQVKSTMLVTLWTFIGIESATVLSVRAKNKRSIGKATLLGFFICLIIYSLLSILPFGFLNQQVLSSIPDPSTAGILELAIGKSGAWIMNIGLIVASLSCWFSWIVIVAETPYAMAKNRNFPRAFKIKNKHDVPSYSLYITSIVMQIAIILVYFSDNAWRTILSITGVMVLPAYLSSALYLFKITKNHEYSDRLPIKKSTAILVSSFGTIFAVWLIYAAGIKYLLMATLFFSLGIPVFIKTQMQYNKEQICNFKEKIIMVLLVITSLFSIYMFIKGVIS